MVRTNPQAILDHGQVIADFTTMYTSFPFELIIRRVGSSVGEAFFSWQMKHPRPEGSPQVRLGMEGFNRLGEGYTICEVQDLLIFLMAHNYTCNGGRVRRQIKGMPMGMPAAPQIANLACYPVEKEWSYQMGRGATAMASRFIDDLYSAKIPRFQFPPPEAYGMEYKVTA